MNYIFGLTIEILVAVLLGMTIVYCWKLNARLKLLKADERAMKTTIAELMLATENAERAIAGLKALVQESDDNLASKLRAADMFNLAMAENLRSGEDVLNRLRKIAHAGKILNGEREIPNGQRADTPASDPAATLAAAQAFTERNRARGLAA